MAEFIQDGLLTSLSIIFALIAWKSFELKYPLWKRAAVIILSSLIHWITILFTETDFTGGYLLPLSFVFIFLQYGVIGAIYLLREKSSQKVWHFLVAIVTVFGLSLVAASIAYLVWGIIR